MHVRTWPHGLMMGHVRTRACRPIPLHFQTYLFSMVGTVVSLLALSILLLRMIAKYKHPNSSSRGRGGGHDRISRHVRTPLYRPRGVISGFEIVLHGVILPPLPLFARAGRIYWLE